MPELIMCDGCGENREWDGYECLTSCYCMIEEDLKTEQSEGPVERVVSLRDYFAGQALVGLMQRHKEAGYDDGGAVTEAFKIADWMIDESNRGAN